MNARRARRITFRLPVALKKKLEEIAKAEGCSVNDLINSVLEGKFKKDDKLDL